MALGSAPVLNYKFVNLILYIGFEPRCSFQLFMCFTVLIHHMLMQQSTSSNSEAAVDCYPNKNIITERDMQTNKQ